MLRRATAEWLRDGPLPILASGMIGSRNGWVEAPYVAAPAGADDLAGALSKHVTPDGAAVHFVPGVTTERDGLPDVMRGEEVQVLGALAAGAAPGYFVLPGTHSKWAVARDGRLEDYATFVTGEAFAALRDHTILGALATEGPFSEESFRAGVESGLTAGPDLLHRLFHARSLALFDRLPSEGVADFLSGLLIGAEIASPLAAGPGEGPVTILGRSDLARRYATALELAGAEPAAMSADVVAHGHLAVARAAGARDVIGFEEAFAERPLVGILRGLRPEEAVGIAGALVDAGLRILEVPLNSPDPFASIERIAERFGESVLVGAGTVLTAGQVDATLAAGGRLIVAPNMDVRVGARVVERGAAWCPGILTPSEAFAALEAGAAALKIFPAELVPPAGVKAMRAVLPPEARVAVVGGITPETMASYLAAGADGFGLGSALYAPGVTPEEAPRAG